MKPANCYEAALQLFDLSEELTSLLNQKEKEKNERLIEVLDTKITKVEAEFLAMKHSLTEIPYVESSRY